MTVHNVLLLLSKENIGMLTFFVEDIYILLIILLANVNSRLSSLYVVVRPSVCLSVVCL